MKMRNCLMGALALACSLTASAEDRLDCSDEQAKKPKKAFEYVITCDRRDGTYACGETATMIVRVRDGDTGLPAKVGKVRVVLDAADDKPFRTDEFDLAETGPEFAVSGTLDKPGLLRLRLSANGAAKSRMWAVAFDPEAIPAGVDDPADFDAFWADAYAKYERDVPFGFEKRYDKANSTSWYDVYRFSFNAPDGRTRLYGFLTYPKDRSRKYPVRFQVPSAGIGSWTLRPAAYQLDRAVTVLLNVFPFEMPETLKDAQPLYADYCRKLTEKFGAKHYMAAGMGARREDSTLYNYFLGAKRCIEWLYDQPEADRSKFCYWGASQGGGYGTCVVGLSGRFTRAVLLVPCLVDDLGRFGRLPSGGGSAMADQQTTPEAKENARRNWPYFSAENFARRIRCETMVGVGLCDPTCVAHGGWSIYNLIPAKRKSILCAVNQPHGPPDPVWYGTQEWLLDESGWKETLGVQLDYVRGACRAGDGVWGTRTTVREIGYLEPAEAATADACRRKACTLDLAYPRGVTNFATVVWFHGGGLTRGGKYFPNLDARRIGVVTANYRLMGTNDVTSAAPALTDAAAAVAWTVRHIAEYGGDPKKVFVSGLSAGGYLTMMVGMDPRWLAKYGLKPTDLAGLAPNSGQATTHFAVKKMRDDPRQGPLPVVDEWSPLGHCTTNMPPIVCLTGQPGYEWPGRAEENELLIGTLKALGHKKAWYVRLPYATHGWMSTCGNPYIELFALGAYPEKK